MATGESYYNEPAADLVFENVGGSFVEEPIWRPDAISHSFDTAFVDLDLDGCIGGADLAILLAFYGTNAPIGDLNGDGTIGGADLATLLARWDPCG